MQHPKETEKEFFWGRPLPDFSSPWVQEENETAFEMRRCPGFALGEDRHG